MSYGSMLHIPPTKSLLLTAKQKPYKKQKQKNFKNLFKKKFLYEKY